MNVVLNVMLSIGHREPRTPNFSPFETVDRETEVKIKIKPMAKSLNEATPFNILDRGLLEPRGSGPPVQGTDVRLAALLAWHIEER